MSNSYEKACHLINRGIFIKITRRRNKKLSSDLPVGTKTRVEPSLSLHLTTNSKVLVGIFFKGSSSGKQWFFFCVVSPNCEDACRRSVVELEAERFCRASVGCLVAITSRRFLEEVKPKGLATEDGSGLVCT